MYSKIINLLKINIKKLKISKIYNKHKNHRNIPKIISCLVNSNINIFWKLTGKIRQTDPIYCHNLPSVMNIEKMLPLQKVTTGTLIKNLGKWVSHCNGYVNLYYFNIMTVRHPLCI